MASFYYNTGNTRRCVTISDDVCQEVTGTWNQFKRNIIHQNRYFSGTAVVDILSELDFVPVFPEGAQRTFYRARIGDFLASDDSEVLAPPPGKASGSRCNPEGISYLYLTSTVETAIQESRPHIGDIVTVASFDVDVSNVFSFDIYKEEPFGVMVKDERARCLIMLILQDLSSAVTVENRLNYIPLQYISEFIKQLGYSGFLYSSVYGSGMNFVMFDWADKISLVSKELYLIRSISAGYYKVM